MSATGTAAASGERRGARSSVAIVARRKGKKLKLRLKPDRSRIAAGETVTLKLKPRGGRRKARQLKRAVRRGWRAKARITITFRDLAGNASRERLTVRLR